jgi:hypothetical protein
VNLLRNSLLLAAEGERGSIPSMIMVITGGYNSIRAYGFLFTNFLHNNEPSTLYNLLLMASLKTNKLMHFIVGTK